MKKRIEKAAIDRFNDRLHSRLASPEFAARVDRMLIEAFARHGVTVTFPSAPAPILSDRRG